MHLACKLYRENLMLKKSTIWC